MKRIATSGNGSAQASFVRSAGRTLCIAHRGASAYAPENTLAAFSKAAELGADMVEVDLHASADGVLVALHDADLGQTTNGSGMVYGHLLAELKRLDAGNGEQIPTAEEVVACCAERGLGIYFELKIGYAALAVVELIQRHNLHGQVIVASFRPDWLADVRGYDAKIQTSVLFHSVHVDATALAHACGAAYVHPCWEYQSQTPHRLLTPEWMAPVRAAGLGIVSWHEERPEELLALRQLELDGICTNAPDLVRNQTAASATSSGC
jgi:glycerophosphoryl diester phosphodiesterase